jgi:hypothetical protein
MFLECVFILIAKHLPKGPWHFLSKQPMLVLVLPVSSTARNKVVCTLLPGLSTCAWMCVATIILESRSAKCASGPLQRQHAREPIAKRIVRSANPEHGMDGIPEDPEALPKADSSPDSVLGADGKALGSAIADFVAGANPYNLGAVPAAKPQQTQVANPSANMRQQANAVDGESDEAELMSSAPSKTRAAAVPADLTKRGNTDATSANSASPTQAKATATSAQAKNTTPAADTKATATSAQAKNTTPAADTKATATSAQAKNTTPAADTKAGGGDAAAPPLSKAAPKPLSPSGRLQNLAGGQNVAGRPEYRPRSALSLARRRMIGTYFPFDWQKGIRRQAEDIPEQQFNYLLSTLVIVTGAFIGGSGAYALWPLARTAVIFIFQADAVEARVLQVHPPEPLAPLCCRCVLVPSADSQACACLYAPLFSPAGRDGSGSVQDDRDSDCRVGAHVRDTVPRRHLAGYCHPAG